MLLKSINVPKGVLGEVLPEPNLNPAATTGFSGSAALDPNLNPPELGVSLSFGSFTSVKPNLNPPDK